MTQLGTTYSTTKRGLIDLLQERPALAEVAISYEAPLQPEDVVGPTGKHESIFFADTNPATMSDDGNQENEVICSLPLKISETYRLPLIIQVLSLESDGTQEVVDRRVDELLGEVLAVVANNPTLGVDAPFEYLHTTRGSFDRFTGVVGQASGHGASVKLNLFVQARLTFLPES